jgi:hypothetical protein
LSREADRATREAAARMMARLGGGYYARPTGMLAIGNTYWPAGSPVCSDPAYRDPYVGEDGHTFFICYDSAQIRASANPVFCPFIPLYICG